MNRHILLCALMLVLGSRADAADSPYLGGMQLLDGYKHHPLQGIDSIVGEIKKDGGLKITYEIGAIPKPGQPRIGGGFTDRPKQTPKAMLRWYREQVVSGQPAHLAYTKDHVLLVSYPQKGMNFSVTVETAEDMADALLMILTYPNPIEPEPFKRDE